MLKTRISKSLAEQLLDIKDRYVVEHPGPFRFEDVIEFGLKSNLMEMPRPNPKKIMATRLRRALRSSRIRDKQGRLVREIIPAKCDRVDENGNHVIDVVWDHLHEMSLDHALQAFDQRDQNISSQRRAATRDVESCLDNNPNVEGHHQKFLFDFSLEDSEPQIVEEILDTPRSPKPR